MIINQKTENKPITNRLGWGCFGIKGKKILNPKVEDGADFIVDGLEIDVKAVSKDFLDKGTKGMKKIAKIVAKTKNNNQFVVFDIKGQTTETIVALKTRLKAAGADMSKIDFIDSSEIKITTY